MADSLDLNGAIKNAVHEFRHALKIVHLNAQSLNCDAHAEEFVKLFEGSGIDIICVSETFYNSSRDYVHLSKYNVFAADRTNRMGGGVAVYVRDDYCCKILKQSVSPHPSTSKPDYIILEVSASGFVVLLACVYRPPKAGYFNEFEAELGELITEYKYTIVAGDVNAHFGSDRPCDVADGKAVVRTLDLCNLSLIPYGVTFRLPNCESWLDMIASNCNDKLVYHNKVPACGFSAHYLLLAVFSFKVPFFQPRRIAYRNFRKVDVNALQDDALNAPWEDIVKLNNVNAKVERFNEILLGLWDKHAPLREYNVSNKPKPWMSNTISTLFVLRDAAYARYCRTKDDRDHASFKKIRNQVNQTIRNAKVRHAHSVFDNSKGPRDMWQNIKKFRIVNPAPPSRSGPSPDLLNSHYTNVDEGDQDLIRDTVNYYESLPLPDREEFHFKHVTSEMVGRAVSSIGSNAKGVDEIPLAFIKSCLTELTPAIVHICNYCLQHGCFPDLWKVALVKPIPKKTNPSEVKDFRPISLLCVLSKVLEKLVHDQMIAYLEEFNILNPFQSGFKKGHSTQTALLKVTSDIRKAIDSRELTILVLYDFSNAFPSVNHKLLLAKLRWYGFSRSAINWFSSYLTGRSQKVVFNDAVSDVLAILLGVPQGSILGPLLFSLYINDINTVFRNSNFHLYADDLENYKSFPWVGISTAVTHINNEAITLNKYALGHNLKINAAKTQAILIGNSKILEKVGPHPPPVVVNGVLIPYTNEVVNLGVIIDKHLTWEPHIIKSCKKAVGAIQQLRRHKELLPTTIRKRLVQALVLPCLDYGCIITHDMSVNCKLEVQKVQNACARFVLDIPLYDHISAHIVSMGWLNMENRRKLFVLVTLFKILRSGAPSYLKDEFVFMSDVHTRCNRFSTLTLRIPCHRTDRMRGAFHVTASSLWNSLPLSIRSLVYSKCTISRFKTVLYNHLFTAQLPQL